MSHETEEEVISHRSTKRPRPSSFHPLLDPNSPRHRNHRSEDHAVRSSWFPTGAIQELQLFHGPASPPFAEIRSDRETRRRRLKDEVRTLTQQLGLVKERLGPASQACAEAVNHASFGGASGADRTSSAFTNSHIEFDRARRLCNPFEVLGEGRRGGLNRHFINRSAVKLANMDYLLNWRLTQLPPGESSFRFVDLCGAPGGFSEYLIQRCQRRHVPACSGYGMSLLGSNEHGRGLDWKLEPFASLENGQYVSFQIVDGVDGTGDVFQWANVESLRSVLQVDSGTVGGITTTTTDRRAHLVVADGGMDAQRDTNHQEQVTQKLVVCQASAALALLQQGGTLLLKMFGWQTPVIRTLMHHLAHLFHSLVAFKPITSRPASAERYVVLTGFRGCPPEWTGPQWQSLVFLGHPDGGALTPLLQAPTVARELLDRYLDDFDRDMLRLNLQTCHDILSRLERKANNDRTTKGDDHRSENTSQLVGAYRSAWDLL